MELHGTWLHADLDPLRHITADLSRENDSRHLSQPMMTLGASAWRHTWVKHPYIKKCTLLSQSPALTSSGAESSLLAVASDKCSPVSGWRTGSTHTSWHTANIRSVRSQTSLWRMIGNPPVGQFRAWSMVNDLPQAHVVGNSGGCHLYLKQMASRKTLLWSANPWLSIGSATNQLDETMGEGCQRC